MILYVLLCRKLSHRSIIIPTCPLSSTGVQTRCHDEAEEKTPPPLHAGTSLASLFLQHKDKGDHKCREPICFPSGRRTQRRNMIVPAIWLHTLTDMKTGHIQRSSALENFKTFVLFPRIKTPLSCGVVGCTTNNSDILEHAAFKEEFTKPFNVCAKELRCVSIRKLPLVQCCWDDGNTTDDLNWTFVMKLSRWTPTILWEVTPRHE